MSATSEQFNPMDHRLAFMRPLRMASSSAWIEHVPFAFALIEMCLPRTVVELGVHAGVSYCAFCQAVVVLELPAKCVGVDTWTGDSQTGEYGAAVLANLRAHHDRLYAKLSTLRQVNFDQAAHETADGSVDLLHIDGLHTYDAVAHDFQTWLPKMSERGVIIMHDTEMKERDFGVLKLWTEISPRYPSMNFNHGFGLGVLAVGKNVPEPLRRFIRLASEEDSGADVLNFFSYLGAVTNSVRMLSESMEAFQRQMMMMNRRRQLINQPAIVIDNADPLNQLAALMDQSSLELKNLIESDLRNRGISPA